MAPLLFSGYEQRLTVFFLVWKTALMMTTMSPVRYYKSTRAAEHTVYFYTGSILGIASQLQPRWLVFFSTHVFCRYVSWFVIKRLCPGSKTDLRFISADFTVLHLVYDSMLSEFCFDYSGIWIIWWDHPVTLPLCTGPHRVQQESALTFPGPVFAFALALRNFPFFIRGLRKSTIIYWYTIWFL